MAATTIKKCTCIHKFQDARYGFQMRVHNKMQGSKKGWRCTVCGSVKADNSRPDVPVEKIVKGV